MDLDLIGKRLGNYQIEQPLGRGGMALVYKAQDVTLKRSVAIKVIAPGLTDEDRYQDRFENEAQSIATLDHPHIVPVYYFGKSKSLFYLAMKFIEGETLEAVMKRYASQGELLPTADILRLFEGITSALDYAHSKGVIHRDVKPSNIMLDSNGHPYLTDFGLALNVQQGTMGEIFGTPHYIAPEQATSSSSAVAQSDLYSLGIILYEMFTSVVPFDDESAMAIALKHITEEPTAPRALNPQLSPALEQVILKALEKGPQGRYQTGAKLLAALRGALRNTSKNDQAKPPVLPPLPPLPPGKKAPPPRQVSNRPVASEVKTMMEQRANAKPAPQPPTPKAPVAVEARPKAKNELVTARPRRRRLRPVLLFLLIIVIAAAGYVFSQSAAPVPLTIPPLALASGPTAVPADWLPVRFVYNDQSFWWVNESSTSISNAPIRFAQADTSIQFEGKRWTTVYKWVDEHNCLRLKAFNAEERVPRPETCDRINADIISMDDEVFWTSGSFHVYWNESLMATCQSSAGECQAALPAN